MQQAQSLDSAAMTVTSGNLLLILARDLAANAATPMFIVDPKGTLLFYNEQAEKVLGRSYSEAGELSADEWGSAWAPEDLEGNPIAPEDLPLAIAFRELHPAMSTMRIHALDGARRIITITAFPLLPRPDELVGAVAIFWEVTE